MDPSSPLNSPSWMKRQPWLTSTRSEILHNRRLSLCELSFCDECIMIKRLVATSSRRKLRNGKHWSTLITMKRRKSTDSEEHSPLVTGRFWSLGGGHRRFWVCLISHLKQNVRYEHEFKSAAIRSTAKIGTGDVNSTGLSPENQCFQNKEKQATSVLQVSKADWVGSDKVMITKATLYHDGKLVIEVYVLELQTAHRPLFGNVLASRNSPLRQYLLFLQL